MVKLFREWAQRLNDRNGYMLPVEEIAHLVNFTNNPGFSSLYAYSEEDAMIIKESGCSRGYDRFVPSSDFLAIDIDTGEEDLILAEDILKGYGYEVWSSGSKGYHIILKHELIRDKRLPYSHSRVVKDLGINADFSLYQPGRIFRLPRCIHQKTGRRKALVRTVEGGLIDVPLLEKPPIEFSFSFGGDGDYKTALGKLWSLAEEGLEEGARNNRMWNVASSLVNAGFELDAVFSFLSTVNNNQISPLSEDELKQVVGSAGRK